MRKIIILIMALSFFGSEVFANNGIPTSRESGFNPISTSAESNNNQGQGVITSPLGEGSDLRTVFNNVLDIAQTIVIMITTLYLIYAGFMFVTAKGDPTKIKKARDALLWGFVGAGLILAAEVIALGIGDTVKEVFKGQ